MTRSIIKSETRAHVNVIASSLLRIAARLADINSNTTKYVLRRAIRAPPGISSEYVQRSRKLTTSKDNLQNLMIYYFLVLEKTILTEHNSNRSRCRLVRSFPTLRIRHSLYRPPNLRYFHYLERCQSKNKNISIISTLLGKGRSIS